jgi:hypothetical protein
MSLFDSSFFVMNSIANSANKASHTTGNALYTAIQTARTKRDIKKITDQAAKSNYISRAVTVMPYVNRSQLLLTTDSESDIYLCNTQSQTPAQDYIWGDSNDPDSLVVSGGTPDVRVQALMPFVHKLQQAAIPIVVLHSGNRDLETMISGHSTFQESVGCGSVYYDAFRGMPVEDIAEILYETMPESTSPNAVALLKATIEMILKTSGKVDFGGLAAYPIPNLMDALDNMYNAQQVSDDDYQAISRDFMTGSSEITAVQSFLYKLNRQIDNVFGKPSGKCCNIRKTINLGGVETFDLGNGANDLVFTVLLNHLLYYQERGKTFALILDNMPISQYAQIRTLLRGSVFAISQQDFVSALYGGEVRGDEIFNELMGSVGAVVLFNHRSGTSCQRWSEHIGKYHKVKIRTQISQSNSFLSSSDNRGIQVEETDEPRIRPETISMLPPSMACVHRYGGTLIANIT